MSQELVLNSPVESYPRAQAEMLGSDASEHELDSASQLMAEGNYPQAELHLRQYQRSGGKGQRLADLFEQLARGYGLPQHFMLSEKNLPGSSGNKYLFIRSWGHGFWSDVHHVLGQLLVAELTHRTPVVWWGENSLFRDDTGANAFHLYFNALTDEGLPAELSDLSIYPSKWNPGNLFGPSLNLWQGVDSRVAAPYLFARPEDLVVSDFYATLASIRPWIAQTSNYFGRTDDEIYRLLCEKYLRPIPTIARQAEVFYQTHMAGRNWISVHVRGSDKIVESPDLHRTNLQYQAYIERILELNPGIGVFLLTDSVEVLESYRTRYGERLLTTSALRTEGNIGIHLQGHDGYGIGQEVLIDVLLAVRGDYFIGNQESNVSLAISSLKHWSVGFIFMLGQESGRGENWFLHRGHHPNPGAGAVSVGSP
jgi:protein O-GlcNAc transferase